MLSKPRSTGGFDLFDHQEAATLQHNSGMRLQDLVGLTPLKAKVAGEGKPDLRHSLGRLGGDTSLNLALHRQDNFSGKPRRELRHPWSLSRALD